MKIKIFLFILLFSVCAFSQTTPTRFRSVTSLPATCRTGNGIVPADAVVLVTGGSNILYVCAATNTWAAPVQSSGTGTIAYFPGTGGSVKGDPSFTDDGSGNIGMVSATFSGATAGKAGFGQGSAPTFKTNTFYLYGPTSVATSVGVALPTNLGVIRQTMCLATVSSPNATFGWCNTPIVGTISLSSETSHSATFTTFNSAPACQITPTTDPTSVGTYWVTSTASSVTANVHSSGSITFNYSCTGNPN